MLRQAIGLEWLTLGWNLLEALIAIVAATAAASVALLGFGLDSLVESGQIMSACALLKSLPRPTEREIEQSMGGNLCRCATYVRIRAAIAVADAGPD